VIKQYGVEVTFNGMPPAEFNENLTGSKVISRGHARELLVFQASLFFLRKVD
jgi:hypothetical protein